MAIKTDYVICDDEDKFGLVTKVEQYKAHPTSKRLKKEILDAISHIEKTIKNEDKLAKLDKIWTEKYIVTKHIHIKKCLKQLFGVFSIVNSTKNYNAFTNLDWIEIKVDDI